MVYFIREREKLRNALGRQAGKIKYNYPINKNQQPGHKNPNPYHLALMLSSGTSAAARFAACRGTGWRAAFTIIRGIKTRTFEYKA